MFLLLSSVFFYGWGEGMFVAFLIVFMVGNYFLAILIDGRETSASRTFAVAATISVNLFVLFFFKYLDFFLGIINPLFQFAGFDKVSVKPLHLPLGISFITFQAIAYAIDVYRQEFSAERNPLKLSLFLALFPKITAGPIIRYQEVVEGLANPELSIENFMIGFKRFVIGMGKKLIIADTLAKTADQIFAIPMGELSIYAAWLGILCYSLQLYFDFSGYTDMAIGLGNMFGFSFRENFNYPYIARSFTEFWRRWHISLSTWFRDYLFIPLSYALVTDKVRKKMTKGKYRTNYRGLFSIFVVFTLCGLWHGANWNFVVWGMFHGLILSLESWKLGKILKKIWSPCAHIYFLLAIMVSWVFFRLPTLDGALHFLASMAGFGRAQGGTAQLRYYVSIELLIVLGFALLGAMPVWRTTGSLLRKMTSIVENKISFGKWLGVRFVPLLEAMFLAAVFLSSLQIVTGAASKPFIYGQF